MTLHRTLVALAVLALIAQGLAGAIIADPAQFSALVPHSALAYVGVGAAFLATANGFLPRIVGRLQPSPFTQALATCATLIAGLLTPLLALGPTTLPFPPDVFQTLALAAIAVGLFQHVLPPVHLDGSPDEYLQPVSHAPPAPPSPPPAPW